MTDRELEQLRRNINRGKVEKGTFCFFPYNQYDYLRSKDATNNTKLLSENEHSMLATFLFVLPFIQCLYGSGQSLQTLRQSDRNHLQDHE